MRLSTMGGDEGGESKASCATTRPSARSVLPAIPGFVGSLWGARDRGKEPVVSRLTARSRWHECASCSAFAPHDQGVLGGSGSVNELSQVRFGSREWAAAPFAQFELSPM